MPTLLKWSENTSDRYSYNEKDGKWLLVTNPQGFIILNWRSLQFYSFLVIFGAVTAFSEDRKACVFNPVALKTHCTVPAQHQRADRHSRARSNDPHSWAYLYWSNPCCRHSQKMQAQSWGHYIISMYSTAQNPSKRCWLQIWIQMLITSKLGQGPSLKQTNNASLADNNFAL